MSLLRRLSRPEIPGTVERSQISFTQWINQFANARGGGTITQSNVSSIETAQARSVLAAATKLKPPIAREEMPDIAASAVSTVLVDALFDYARAAFVDGFAGRGVPLPFYGFSGGISGRFSNIRIMPSGELPRWELADPSQSASTAPDKAPTAAPSDLQPAPKQSP
jgi:hypothetical protein